jgi:integrase
MNDANNKQEYNLFNDFVGPEFRAGADVDALPTINVEDLTEESTIREAIYAYCKSAIITGYLGRGSKRAADHYIYLAKEIGDTLIKDASSRKSAAMLRDKKWGHLSAGTTNNKLTKLANVFGWLYDYDIVDYNPFKEIKRVKASQRNKIHKKKITTIKLGDKETQDFIDYLDGVCPRTAKMGMYGALFRVSLFTSLRYSEVLNIKAEWIDEEKMLLWLPSEFTKMDTPRKVYITEACMAVLKEHWPTDGKGKFFTVGYNSWYQMVWRYNQEHGTNFHIHKARHDRITKFAKNSGSIIKTMSVSGHKSIQALQHYLHEDTDEEREEILQIMNKIDEQTGAAAIA